MNDHGRFFVLAAFVLGVVALLLASIAYPAVFSNGRYLGGILVLQIIAISLWHFERTFFPFLVISFLWAGTQLPFQGVGASVRWLVLGFGAWAGFILWIRASRQHRFGLFHLTALFALTTALVSALVSPVPTTAALKVLGLALLFLYSASGARLAFHGHEINFTRGLLLSCEVVAYGSALSYLVFHFRFFGNLNALGGVMGVVVVPVLLWGLVLSQEKLARHRLTFTLLLSGYLLYSTLTRAAILGAAVATVAFCLALRRHMLLLRIGFVAVLFLAIVGLAEPGQFEKFVNTVSADLLYKGKTDVGVFGSRVQPWNKTIASIKQHPWFGTGFGTSLFAKGTSDGAVGPSTLIGTNREHGSSYLALVEYVGLVGTVPFGVLIFLMVWRICRVWFWIRASGDVSHYSVPLVLVATSALVHAAFEDWLLAAGSYLCVFFWPIAFILMDFVPRTSHQQPQRAGARTAALQPSGFEIIPPGNPAQLPLRPNL